MLAAWPPRDRGFPPAKQERRADGTLRHGGHAVPESVRRTDPSVGVSRSPTEDMLDAHRRISIRVLHRFDKVGRVLRSYCEPTY